MTLPEPQLKTQTLAAWAGACFGPAECISASFFSGEVKCSIWQFIGKASICGWITVNTAVIHLFLPFFNKSLARNKMLQQQNVVSSGLGAFLVFLSSICFASSFAQIADSTTSLSNIYSKCVCYKCIWGGSVDVFIFGQLWLWFSKSFFFFYRLRFTVEKKC